MSRSTSISLAVTLLACSMLLGGPALAQNASQPNWVNDIANSMNAVAAGQGTNLGQSSPAGTGIQPNWVRDIGSSMNATAGSTIVDVGPAPQPSAVLVEPEYLGDSIPMTIPGSSQPAASMQDNMSMQAPPVNTTNMAMPFNTGNMNMPFNSGMQSNAMQGNNMGMQGNMMGSGHGQCSGNFHGCCGHNHAAPQAMDPCKAMFGLSQQEVGATAAVAGIMLYPNVVQSLIRSNPQMQTQVSRFLGGGPANGF